MSAIAVLRRDNGIVVACDGISYGDDGIVRHISANKVVAVPEWDCLIGNVGAGNFAVEIRATMAQKYHNFDDVIGGVATDFTETFFGMAARGEFHPGGKCTLFLAGWSVARERFESYRISTTDKDISIAGEKTTIPAGTVAPISGDWVSSEYLSEDRERFGLDTEDNVLHLAVRYICACRGASSMDGSGEFAGVPYAVGGRLMLFLLQRDSLQVSVAHRWPDQVGQVLDPNAGEPMPAFLK